MGPEAASFRPMPKKILVRPDPQIEQTKGGIILPDTAVKRAQTGTVIAVGADCDAAIQPGVRVYVSYWAAFSVELDGTDYRLYLEKDLGGVLTPSA